MSDELEIKGHDMQPYLQKLLFTSLISVVAAMPVFAEDGIADGCGVDGGTHILLSVENITSDEGNLRAQLYGSNPEEFLEKGKKLVRVEVAAHQGETELCVPVPEPGQYALVVMHDRNANGKADVFTEGFGFSNNPDLGLSKPEYDEVVFLAEEGVSKQSVKLKYLLGSDADKAKRKRARRR